MELNKFKDITEVHDIETLVNKKLKDNEYLLKVNSYGVGFMTKLNKTGAVPVAWREWQERYGGGSNMKMYIINEEYRKGWKLTGHRLGMSQAWAEVTHPFGFTMEVNLKGIIDTLQKSELDYGVFQIEMKYHQAGKSKQLQSILDI